jgi:NAD(P)H-hydrate epimerase
MLDNPPAHSLTNHPDHWRGLLPTLNPAGNKYDRGHALVIGGYPLTGAARLAAWAASRAGAGLTTLAVPPIALPLYGATVLASQMVRPVAGGEELAAVLADRRITAVLLGPGAGVTDQTKSYALQLLASALPQQPADHPFADSPLSQDTPKRAVVLDADALTVFAGDTPLLEQATAVCQGACVLTPHEGEFARLYDLPLATADQRISSARTAAARCGAILVLKGHHTVIAAPDGRVLVNRNAPSTLATAGAGDVLAGIILGLLAQGMEPFAAAAAAVWLHGAAATTFGVGLIADDLPDLLPKVLAELLAGL